MKGIDVSENNGTVDWQAVANAGVEFAIVRLGYGNGHLDSKFYENINGAIDAGLEVGVYYYSYALTQDDAENEADFIINTLQGSGLTTDKLTIGVWIDEEDADGWRERNGLNYYKEPQKVTNMATATINKFWDAGYTPAGIYMNCDWLENVIDLSQTGGAGLWLAQPGASTPDYSCNIWQYSFEEEIGGQVFDGDILY